MFEFLSSLTGIVTVTGALAGAWYLYRMVSAQDTSAELAAKNEAISTQQQVNDANAHRIDQLEIEVNALRLENDALRLKVENLEQYAAEPAVRRFEERQEVHARRYEENQAAILETQKAVLEILRAIQIEIGTRKP